MKRSIVKGVDMKEEFERRLTLRLFVEAQN